MVTHPRLPPNQEVLKTPRLSRIATYQSQNIQYVKTFNSLNKQRLATALAPLALVLAQHALAMQIYQEKVPVFRGKKDKDTLTVIGWCYRIKAMKTSFV